MRKNKLRIMIILLLSVISIYVVAWPPASVSAAEKEEYILKDSDIRLLTADDLYGLSAAELRIARNEIYARYGRKFAAADLASYFQSKSWYEGTIEPGDFVESTLSFVERSNVNLIISVESGTVIPQAPVKLPDMMIEPGSSLLMSSALQEYEGTWYTSMDTGFSGWTGYRTWEDYLEKTGYQVLPEVIDNKRFLIYDNWIFYTDDPVNDLSGGGWFGQENNLSYCELDGNNVNVADNQITPYADFFMDDEKLFYNKGGNGYPWGSQPEGYLPVAQGYYFDLNTYENVQLPKGRLVCAAYGYFYLVDEGNLYRIRIKDWNDSQMLASGLPENGEIELIWNDQMLFRLEEDREDIFRYASYDLKTGRAEGYRLPYHSGGWFVEDLQDAYVIFQELNKGESCVYQYSLTSGELISEYRDLEVYTVSLHDGILYAMTMDMEELVGYQAATGEELLRISLESAKKALAKWMYVHQKTDAGKEGYEILEEDEIPELLNGGVVAVTEEAYYCVFDTHIYAVYNTDWARNEVENPYLSDAYYLKVYLDGRVEVMDSTFFS